MHSESILRVSDALINDARGVVGQIKLLVQEVQEQLIARNMGDCTEADAHRVIVGKLNDIENLLISLDERR